MAIIINTDNPQAMTDVRFISKYEKNHDVGVLKYNNSVVWQKPVEVCVHAGQWPQFNIDWNQLKCDWNTEHGSFTTTGVGQKYSNNAYTDDNLCLENVTFPAGFRWNNFFVAKIWTNLNPSDMQEFNFNDRDFHMFESLHPYDETRFATVYHIDLSKYIEPYCEELRVIVYDNAYTGNVTSDGSTASFDSDRDGVLYNLGYNKAISVTGKTTSNFKPKGAVLTSFPFAGEYTPICTWKISDLRTQCPSTKIEIRQGELYRYKLTIRKNNNPDGTHRIKNLRIQYQDSTGAETGFLDITDNNAHFLYLDMDSAAIRPIVTAVTDDRLDYVMYTDNGSNKYVLSNQYFPQGFQRLSTTNYCNAGNPSNGDFWLDNIDTIAFNYIEMKYERSGVWSATNHMNVPVTLGYNKKMCFANDAKNWTNLNDKVSITLGAGEKRELRIEGNWAADTVVCCYISGDRDGRYRWISYMINGDTTDRNNRIDA